MLLTWVLSCILYVDSGFDNLLGGTTTLLCMLELFAGAGHGQCCAMLCTRFDLVI